MDVYIFVVLITFYLCHHIRVPNNDIKAYQKKVFWVFVPILIFGALRVDFGTDYRQYEMWYYEWHKYLKSVDYDEHAEVGYQWLNMIVPSWRLLLIIVSSAVVGAFIMMYSKYVAPKMLMLAVMFTMLYPDQTFFLSFVSMRNGLAIAGTYMCLPLIIKRNYRLLIPITFGLSLFHTSALVFLPMAIIAGLNRAVTKKEIYAWIIAFSSLAIMSTTSLFSLFESLTSLERFERYAHLEGDDHTPILNCTVNAILAYFIVSWAYRNRKILTKAQNTIWRLSLLYLLTPFLGSLGRTRMTYYYIPFYIITITFLMNDKWPAKWQKQLFIGLAVAVMLYATFVVWMFNPHFVFAHYHSVLGELF